MQYLVFQPDDPDVDLMLVTNARTELGARWDYALKVGIKESWFKSDIYCRSVNMSFSERFFLATDEEVARFSQTGDISVDDQEFERRVKQFFKDSRWSQAYLSMWNDRETPQDELAARHPFPDDMLCFMFLGYDPKGDGLTVVPLEDLKR